MTEYKPLTDAPEGTYARPDFDGAADTLTLGNVTIYAHSDGKGAVVVWIDTDHDPDPAGTNLRVNVNAGGVFGYPRQPILRDDSGQARRADGLFSELAAEHDC